MPETRLAFQEELQDLENRALEGLDMVVTTLERTMEALQHQDVELAEMVIVDDDRIDGRYLEVHQGILSLLARQAPVATDLRLVAALLDVIKHVERMGDQCVNIAKVIPVTGHEPPTDRAMLEALAEMGRHAVSLVEQSKRAFASRNVELAQDLVVRDETINRLQRECFRIAIEIGDDIDSARVGHDDAAGGTRPRARRRQRRGHRRADRLRGDRAVPRVHRRLASREGLAPQLLQRPLRPRGVERREARVEREAPR